MTPAARLQIIIGAFATAAVAFLSYFVVKRQLVRGKHDPAQKGITREQVEGAVSAGDENVSSEVLPELQNQETKHTGGGESSNENAEGKKDKLAGEGQEQTSFYVIDNGEDAVPPDNGQHHKKSDRSSDDSSYDVIEDEEQLAEAVEEGGGVEDGERDEGGHALADGSDLKQQDTFLDENEASMIIIEDLDQSNQSKSESSCYASADEHPEAVSALDEIRDEENNKLPKLSDVLEDTSLSTADISFPSADLDFSLLSDKDKVEDELTRVGSSGHMSEPRSDFDFSLLSDKVEAELTGDGSSGHVSEAKVPGSSDAPLAAPEEFLSDNSSAQTTENVTSRLDIVLKSEPDISQDTTAKDDVELEASDITEILTLCQNSPSTVSKENIRMLVSLLRKKVPELHSTVLNCVLRVAAFTQNVKTLRDSGCLEVVADQVQEASRTVSEEGRAELLNSLCQVLTNLTLDPKCQAELEKTVPSLIGLLLSSDSEPVKLSVLRPLINFSSLSSFHNHYIHAVQNLYDLLQTGSHIAKVQSLKILVNLSLNENMMPQLLAAKAPTNLMELLDLPTPTDLILRTLTMLANIEVALHKDNVLLASIPEEVKTASPETVYMVLHGTIRLPVLRSKVLRLTRHNDEDVSHQASKLHQYVQDKSGSVRQ